MYYRFKLTLICITLTPIFVSSQITKQQSFYFKGYETQLRATAHDTNGHSIFVGDIRTVEKDATQRDRMIDSLLGETSNTINEHHGIVIVTDKNLQIKKVKLVKFIHLNAATYDAEKNCFWIGGRMLTYFGQEEIRNRSQIFLVEYHLPKDIWNYFQVETRESYTVKDIQPLGESILTWVEQDTIVSKQKLQIPAIVEISTSTFHKMVNMPHRNTPNILKATSMPTTPLKCILTSSLSKLNNFYVSGSSSCDYELKTGFNNVDGFVIYKYVDGKVNSEKYIGQGSDPTFSNIIPSNDGNLLLSYSPSVFQHKVIVDKIDKQLNLIWRKSIDARYIYLANEILQMPDGKIVFIAENMNKKWSYYILDSFGNLLKEIDSGISSDTHSLFLSNHSSNEFMGGFSTYSKVAPSIVQILKTE